MICWLAAAALAAGPADPGLWLEIGWTGAAMDGAVVLSVPYDWLDEGVIAPELRAELAIYEPHVRTLAELVPDAGDRREFRISREADEVVLAVERRAVVAGSGRKLVVEIDEEGQQGRRYALPLAGAAVVVPMVQHAPIEGGVVSGELGDLVDLRAAVARLDDVAPFTLLEVRGPSAVVVRTE